MRTIKFGPPSFPDTDPPVRAQVRNIDHWSEIAPKEVRTFNMVPFPSFNGGHPYAVTSEHWTDFLTSDTSNWITMPWGPHVALAYGTTHEAAMAAWRLLNMVVE